MEIKRLHLASLRGPDGLEWPVHGFVLLHPAGPVLVDTGVGGPDQVLSDWRVVNRSVADALATVDLAPADISLVINTHLHFDHCGQNAVFSHAPCYVQRAELARSRREEPELYDWFGFMNGRFELLDGDAEVLPGISVMATPGHTEGHQCVLVEQDDLLIGDAAYTPRQYKDPAGTAGTELPPGQASDLASWQASLRRIRSAAAGGRVHFCHHTDVLPG